MLLLTALHDNGSWLEDLHDLSHDRFEQLMESCVIRTISKRDIQAVVAPVVFPNVLRIASAWKKVVPILVEGYLHKNKYKHTNKDLWCGNRKALLGRNDQTHHNKLAQWAHSSLYVPRHSLADMCTINARPGRMGKTATCGRIPALQRPGTVGAQESAIRLELRSA